MMPSPDLLEPSIQQFGQILASQAHRHSPKVWDHRWWTDALLDWGTRDEQFKVQLFRFIDVLPALKTDEQFIRILTEYFQNVPSLPIPFRWLLPRLSRNPVTGRIATRLLRRQFLRMAYTFMAGESVEQAIPTLSHLWENQCGSSVDLLGEASVSEQEADRYHRRCLEALQEMHLIAQKWGAQPLLEADHLGPIPRVQLSIKLSALYSQLDPIAPQACYEALAPRLRSIIDLARTLPASITFDMEQAELEPLTLYVFTRLFSEEDYKHFPHAGIALQAYLQHSQDSLTRLLTWGKSRPAPFGIRLVKGAYWDSEIIRYQQRGWKVPVFQKKPDTDANFEKLAQTLLEHRAFIRPAFGSHNIRTLACIQALSKTFHLAPGTCEYQMLFGMAEPLRTALIRQGIRLRVYTPVGELLPGMAYLVRRLLENTSNEGFIRRQQETTESLDQLLLPPLALESRQTHPESFLTPMEDEQSNEGKNQEFFNEPHTDFSRLETHGPWVEALARIQPLLGQTYELPLPTGLRCQGAPLKSIHPGNPEQCIARFPTIAPDDLGHVIEKAKSNLSYWQEVDVTFRSDILFHTADLMHTKREELAAWEILETGKPWREADADISEAIDFLRWYGQEMRVLNEPTTLGGFPGELNIRTFLPRGLALILPPWNFSLAIPTGLVSAALVTGNIVLFKPSERAPMMGYHLVTILREAGLPEGVLYFLPGGPEIGETLVKHPDIHLIAFTGSQAVGTHILQEATKLAQGQRHFKHVIAEMGGKNAILVDDTADLDEAVTGVLQSATGYQGQKCSACSRVVVFESVFQTFVTRLTEAARSLRIGPAEQQDSQMGPVIDSRALERIRQYVELGKRDGTCLLDRQEEGPGYFQGPVIFTDLPTSHPVVQEEIFGPVLAVFKVSSISEAVKMMNDSPFALTGGIYSRSPRAIEFARKWCDVGNFYINRPITGSLVSRQPFGGHRLSGVGQKAGGKDYLQQFMVEKISTENTLRRGFAPAP